MSAELEFRNLLTSHPGLAALVGTRIAEAAVPEGAVLPYVAFNSRHDITHNLLGQVMSDEVQFTVQCWAESASAAAAVAAQVMLAVSSADVQRGAVVLSTETAYDPELRLDAAILTVEWWAL
jgi:hypothetical protein